MNRTSERLEESLVLRSVTEEDLNWLVDAIDVWPTTRRWDLRDRTPSPQFLHKLVWDPSILQLVVMTRGRFPVGLIQLVDVDLYHGHANLAFMFSETHQEQFSATLTRFMSQAFAVLPLRKIYVEAYADRLDARLVIGESARPVGLLPDHQRRRAERFVDLLISEVHANVPLNA